MITVQEFKKNLVPQRDTDKKQTVNFDIYCYILIALFVLYKVLK